MSAVTFQFHVPFSGSNVDRGNAIIRDVALITGDLIAEGHDLAVDSTTLSQILLSAQKAGKVPVKLNHGSGIENVCGYLENFRLEGNKVKGDWHLLKSHDETEKMLERAERMPTAFGLSVAFKGKGVDIGGGKKAARCEELKAVDCVASPAANPDGLFSAKEVDTQKTISMSTQNKTTEFSADDIKAIIEENAQLKAQMQELTEANQGQNPEGAITDEELAHLATLSPEELAEAGIAMSDVIGELSNRGYDVSALTDGDDAGEGEGEGAGEGAEANAGAMANALSALRREVTELKAREKNKEIQFARQAQEEAEMVLSAKVDGLIEMNERLSTENEALKATVKRFQSQAPRPALATHLFDSKGDNAGEYEGIVTAKYAELKAAGVPELSAKSRAVDFAVKNHPAAYAEFRKRGSKEIKF